MRRRRWLAALGGAGLSGMAGLSGPSGLAGLAGLPGIGTLGAATRSVTRDGTGAAVQGPGVGTRAASGPVSADPLGAMHAVLAATTGTVFDALWSDPRFELQLIYTRVDRLEPLAMGLGQTLRQAAGASPAAPQLTHFRRGVEAQRWFAPASLVKLPVAALALERIAESAPQGVTRESPFALDTTLRCMQAAAAETESVARAIRRMFVVSENQAFNRLYEMLGQNRIHQRFAALGLPHSRVINRIAPCSPGENRVTGAITFLDSGRRVLARIEGETAQQARRFPHGRALKGRAWVEGGKILPGPRDFSERNFIPLDEAHRMLIALVMPEALPPAQRFALDADAHVFLRQCMGMLPAECTDPLYRAGDFPETFSKYLIGGAGLAALPPGVRSFNKVGRSFGYLSDCAYLVDAVRGAEFFLSASVYVNRDDVLNDGRYEYQETGWPFLAALGRAALDVDAARARAQPAALLGADGRFSL